MPVVPSCVAEKYSIVQATTAADLAAVRALCWDYRDFMRDNTAIDREITETFYPVPKYQALMDALPVIHARPQGIILLARSTGNAPLACGMTHPLDSQSAEIKRIFVAPAARGTGLGKSLCRTLMDQAQRDGFQRVVLDTSESLKAAAALYLKLGFVERGPYQPVPDNVLPLLRFFEYRLDRVRSRPDTPTDTSEHADDP